MDDPLAGRVADPRHLLLIGAGVGIGAAVARRFAREGLRLTLVARDGDRLDALCTALSDEGAVVRAVVADAGDPYGLRAALADTIAADPPGVVVYNAAQVRADDLLLSDGPALAGAYSVNVVGAIVCAQLAVPAMRAGGGGTILFTGGDLADDPGPEWGTLSLGKVTLRAVAVILAKQLAAVPVHVAYVTIMGDADSAGSGTPFAADRIADAYWEIHAQDAGDWQTEYRYDGG